MHTNPSVRVTLGIGIVFIPEASSSVGLAAIQIANYAGATRIALTRTSDKKKHLHEAGAAHVIATQEQDVVAEVMLITNGNDSMGISTRYQGRNRIRQEARRYATAPHQKTRHAKLAVGDREPE
jgi:NADPH:quinone reductase-like Zn-dependent oxidoreductase